MKARRTAAGARAVRLCKTFHPPPAWDNLFGAKGRGAQHSGSGDCSIVVVIRDRGSQNGHQCDDVRFDPDIRWFTITGRGSHPVCIDLQDPLNGSINEKAQTPGGFSCLGQLICVKDLRQKLGREKIQLVRSGQVIELQARIDGFVKVVYGFQLWAKTPRQIQRTIRRDDLRAPVSDGLRQSQRFLAIVGRLINELHRVLFFWLRTDYPQERWLKMMEFLTLWRMAVMHLRHCHHWRHMC